MVRSSHTSRQQVLALRVAGLDAPSPVSQYWGMIRAHNLEQFIDANSALQMPFFNVIYADRNGRIMYLFGGRQPVRSGGNFYDWAGILPVTGRARCGLARSNGMSCRRPSIRPAASCRTATMHPGRRRSRPPSPIPTFRLDRATRDGSATAAFAGFLLSKASLRPTSCWRQNVDPDGARRSAGPDLISAANVSGDPAAVAAAGVLAAWDHNADADSRGALLFEAWYDAYSANRPCRRTRPCACASPTRRSGSATTLPTRCTRRRPGETAIAVQTLVGAAVRLQSVYGAIDVAWATSTARPGDARCDLANVIPVSNDR